jgi:SnoaL-like domain
MSDKVGAETMSRSMPTALQRWYNATLRRDAAALDELLAEDVVFLSPVGDTPQKGRTLGKHYLAAALSVLANEHFRYTGEWIGEHSAVLEFTTRLGATEINGVDIIGWNEGGRIASFKVMVRPLQAMQALQQAMAAMLSAMQQQQ